MNLKISLRYAAYTLITMGLIGIISEAGPRPARYSLLSLGAILLLISMFIKQKPV